MSDLPVVPASMRATVVVVRVVCLIDEDTPEPEHLGLALEHRQDIIRDLEHSGLLDSWADDGVVSIGAHLEEVPDLEVEPWPS